MMLTLGYNRRLVAYTSDCNDDEFTIAILNAELVTDGIRLTFNVKRDKEILIQQVRLLWKGTLRYSLEGKSPKTIVKQLNDFYETLYETRRYMHSPTMCYTLSCELKQKGFTIIE
jgi:hypothetical protein